MAGLLALIVLITVITLIYRWSIATYGFFEQRNIPFVKPVPLLGALRAFIAGRQHISDAISSGYNLFPESKFSGVFLLRNPVFLIHDLQLLKRITIKDFDHFSDHANVVPLELDPVLGRSLFFADGPRWRHGRTGLSPAFTGSKMRNMFTLLSTCTEAAMKRLVEDAGGSKLEKEMKDLFQRLGNDVMTSISFGVEIDSVHDPDNEFFIKGKRLAKINGWQGLKLFMVSMLPPKLFITLGIRMLPPDVGDFYEDIVAKTIKYREENNIARPDFIHLLTQARKKELNKEASDEKLSSAGFSTVQEHLQSSSDNPIEWSNMDIAASASSFFFGGIETTTTLLCFASYELSLNPEIQNKLHNEIDTMREDLGKRKLTYEDIQRMKYLDMVVTETLRKWPPLGTSNRMCTKNYVMENSDGTKVTVEKGQLIGFSVHAIHRDPKYYPEPLRFDPERFSEQNRHEVNQDAYLPFGSGPRNCIGSRLALMQAKCILYYLLANFDVVTSERTDVPIQLNNRSVGLEVKNGFWVYLVPRVK